MFDVSHLLDRVGDLFANGGAMQASLGGGILDAIGATDIDPALLESALPVEVAEAIGAGEDISSMADGQLIDVLDQIRETGGP